MKTCTKCGIEQPLSEFNKRKPSPDGLSYDCKTCNKARLRARAESKGSEAVRAERRASYAKHRQKHKDMVRYARVGITQEQYRSMWEAQQGKCKSCGDALLDTHEYKSGTRPSNGAVIDHCHASGAVRGILCNYCNLMLGYAKDEPSRLAAAIKYLESAS